MVSLEEVSNCDECIINEESKYDKISQKVGVKAMVSRNITSRELILSAAPHLNKEQQSYYENEVKKEYIRSLILLHH